MTTIASIANVAALIGEPARTAILVTLMDGRALTAGELARAAAVTAPTASGHLGQLLQGGLLALERQGRHRYYRLASQDVAALLEGLMSMTGQLGSAGGRSVVTGPRDKALRQARRCYDHLAGEVAVAIADNMAARGQLDFTRDGGVLTETGLAFLSALGIELSASRPMSSRRPTFCRPCLDWSERKPHIGGAVGREMYVAFVDRNWLRQPGNGRAVAITPSGRAAFERYFDVAWT